MPKAGTHFTDRRMAKSTKGVQYETEIRTWDSSGMSLLPYNYQPLNRFDRARSEGCISNNMQSILSYPISIWPIKTWPVF